MDVRLTKCAVATRQLDTAIKLFFNAGDIVSIHTLAAASATVFADLLEQAGHQSWRQKIVEENPHLTRRQIIDALREAQNFFKHADRDPEATFEFSDLSNDAMIFIATLECGLLIGAENKKRPEQKKLSTSMSVFQLWHIATKPDELNLPEPQVVSANSLFPNIRSLPRFEQLSFGSSVLKERVALKQATSVT